MNHSKYTDPDYQNRVRDFVNREVIYGVSGLISDLSRANCKIGDTYPEEYWELFQSAPDYEEALFQNDVTEYRDEYGARCWKNNAGDSMAGSPEEACDYFDIDGNVYRNEVFEHWIVSEWLASRLEERGEAVNRDLHGLTVWGRTTSGQAILLDRVICDIYDELNQEAIQ